VEDLATNIPEDVDGSVLFVITADHGHVMGERVDLPRELLDLLTCPPCMEARSPAFYLKDNSEQGVQEFKEVGGEKFNFNSLVLHSFGHEKLYSSLLLIVHEVFLKQIILCSI
jgi:hypothetical protein